MANWNQPTINSNYIDFVDQVNNRDVDAIRLDGVNPTNLPINAIRFNRASNIFEELTTLPSTWTSKILGITGGGTGGSDAASARTALGIGTMGTQNSNAVNITGGSITGVALDAGSITIGILALSRGGTGASLAIGGAGTVLLSNGAAVGFDTGINISQLNASSLSAGTVSDGRLSANVALKNINNNFVAQTFASFSSITGPNSVLSLINPNSPVNNRHWRFVSYNGGPLSLEALIDSGASANASYTYRQDGFFESAGFIGNGGNISGLNASQLTLGTVPLARLGTNAPNASLYLRGDNTWQTVAAPSIPSGLIAIFDTNCPVGWTRVSALDNRFPMGSPGWGSAGGTSQHSHNVNGNTSTEGQHGHTFSGDTDGPNGHQQVQATGSASAPVVNHWHHFSGQTDLNGNHNHNFNQNTNDANHIPPYLTVVYCRKD